MIVVDPELHALCPPLRDEERAGLEASIATEGCRDPLAVAFGSFGLGAVLWTLFGG